MPLPSGKATFEEALALMQSTKDPVDAFRHFPVVVEGIEDLKNRMSVIERGYLDVRTRVATAETKVADTMTVVASTATDTKAASTRVDDLSKAPHDHGKRLDALEDRVRTVEGAVGSTPAPEPVLTLVPPPPIVSLTPKPPAA